MPESRSEIDHLRDELSGLREDYKMARAQLADACDELDHVRQWWKDAERVRCDVERVLDAVLGTEEDDGAGAGLVQDVRYALAVARQQGRAEIEARLTAVTALAAAGDVTTLDDIDEPVVLLCDLRAALNVSTTPVAGACPDCGHGTLDGRLACGPACPQGVRDV